MPFAQLGLRAELTEAVAAKGYNTPSPIQSRAIPAILEGRDVLGGAQTGTGKTAAFSLPVLQRLAAEPAKSRRPRALVLAPTRELAAQVQESIVSYGSRLRISSTVIFGGVGFNQQISTLRRGVDIIVATPGRLLDLCERGEAKLSGIEILVLDEADRMLDMGFIHDIKRILKLLPERRQTLFFSATYAKEVKTLADTILRDPVEVEVTPRNSTAERVDQEAYLVTQKSKRETLSAMVDAGDWSQTLVFTRTKHGANRLATQLEKDGITAAAIHGNKSQSARERALAAFKANRIRVLVATDIAARGLDIVDLPYVVNFELPNVPEDYVHRIGRTGRAGKSGKAISLVSEDEEAYLLAIERLLKREIPLFVRDRAGEARPADRSRLSAKSPSSARPQSGNRKGGSRPAGPGGRSRRAGQSGGSRNEGKSQQRASGAPRSTSAAPSSSARPTAIAYGRRNRRRPATAR